MQLIFPDRLQNDSEESIQTIPTIGFNVEVLQYKNIKFQVSISFNRLVTYIFILFSLLVLFCLHNIIYFLMDDVQVWDLGGQTSIRPYWRCYYPNTDAIIFVVDSCDVERLGVAKQELMAMLGEEELKDAILLVFANKQDSRGALNAQQVRCVLRHHLLLSNKIVVLFVS